MKQEEKAKGKEEKQEQIAPTVPPLALKTASTSLSTPMRPSSSPSNGPSSAVSSARTNQAPNRFGYQGKTGTNASSSASSVRSNRRGVASAEKKSGWAAPRTPTSAAREESGVSGRSRFGMSSTMKSGRTSLAGTQRRDKRKGLNGTYVSMEGEEGGEGGEGKDPYAAAIRQNASIFHNLWILSTGGAMVLGGVSRPTFDVRKDEEKEKKEKEAEMEKERARARERRMESRHLRAEGEEKKEGTTSNGEDEQQAMNELEENRSPSRASRLSHIAQDKARREEEQKAFDELIGQTREWLEAARKQREEEMNGEKVKRDAQLEQLNGERTEIEREFEKGKEESSKAGEEKVEGWLKTTEEMVAAYEKEMKALKDNFAVVAREKVTDEASSASSASASSASSTHFEDDGTEVRDVMIGDDLVARFEEMEESHEAHAEHLTTTLESTATALQESEEGVKRIQTRVVESIERLRALEEKMENILPRVKEVEVRVGEAESEDGQAEKEDSTAVSEVRASSEAVKRAIEEERRLVSEVVNVQSRVVSFEEELFTEMEKGLIQVMKEGAEKREGASAQRAARGRTVAANGTARLDAAEKEVAEKAAEAEALAVSQLSTQGRTDTGLRVDAMVEMSTDAAAILGELVEERAEREERLTAEDGKREECFERIGNAEAASTQRAEKIAEHSTSCNEISNYVASFEPLVSSWQATKEKHVCEVAESVMNNVVDSVWSVVSEVEEALNSILNTQRDGLVAAEEKGKHEMDDAMEGLVEQMGEVEKVMSGKREDLAVQAQALGQRHSDEVGWLDAKVNYIEDSWKRVGKKGRVCGATVEKWKRAETESARTQMVGVIETEKKNVIAQVEQMAQA
ncbi:uncharacterized protein MONOS_1013 [Monocercomonoides exilis]|uniref:uncharacterized protein n=1 Tax=Monocercomonoides exilis TaxID=2049356 RepID=UPI003559A8EF|nr:hypothetical protein MONOS_1013 [Monocercomonoides exilis]|eukprot:MONOS_1013.1-p1 / transcript=MONOS_1013.1 / gene=MONOS_1013 / organism=Monocercomonoides_exilis_PA203 / gene_product=unspecified product / transcript_product=unspecified product / location=Mono_scaffold00017:42854-45783(+) / protein_length=860 / sequence_SO=supercontig / SO=protein_coding / is_pseudo=false